MRHKGTSRTSKKDSTSSLTSALLIFTSIIVLALVIFFCVHLIVFDSSTGGLAINSKFIINNHGKFTSLRGLTESSISSSSSSMSKNNENEGANRDILVSPLDLLGLARTIQDHPNQILWPSLLESPAQASTRGYSYPYYRSLLNIIKDWNPDNPDPPKVFFETLQHFDYSNATEREIAARFRDAEIPFKVYNVPEIDSVSNKWNDEYLLDVLAEGRGGGHVEESKTNHFMYWKIGNRDIRNYKPPTDVIDMKFNEWLPIAKKADEVKLTNASHHFYFMTNAPTGDRSRTFVARDLPLFATDEENFFVTDVNANKGIQCRFGMRGIIAEAHYDSGRNMVAMLKGQKRYILAPPSACKTLGIIADNAHPSYRHSVIDWSNIDEAKERGFANAQGIDTIVRKGEVLYIPSFWFHYIVSLEYSIQCNTRSGYPPNGEGANFIESEDCMDADLSVNKPYGKERRKGKHRKAKS